MRNRLKYSEKSELYFAGKSFLMKFINPFTIKLYPHRREIEIFSRLCIKNASHYA
jgi:hypothetical protein